MPHLGPTELLIILAVVLLLFGGRKLPDLAKGLGEGLREFKKATKDSDRTPEVPEAEKTPSVEAGR